MDFPCLLLFSRDLVTSVATRFLAVVLISGRDIVGSVLLRLVVVTLLAQCFSRVDVTTMVSRSDLVVFPFYCILSHDLSSLSALLFFVVLHVATSILGCGHISISTAYVLGCDFFFLVATLFVVFCLRRFRI